jgi:hypothetical protein
MFICFSRPRCFEIEDPCRSSHSERSLIGLKLYDCVIIEFQKMPFHHHLYIYYIDIPAS